MSNETLQLTDIPKKAGDYSLQEFEGESLLYSTAHTKTVYLNETASLIWQLCDGSRSVEQLVALIESEMESPGAISQDVMSTLTEFKKQGVISLA